MVVRDVKLCIADGGDCIRREDVPVAVGDGNDMLSSLFVIIDIEDLDRATISSMIDNEYTCWTAGLPIEIDAQRMKVCCGGIS